MELWEVFMGMEVAFVKENFKITLPLAILAVGDCFEKKHFFTKHLPQWLKEPL